MITNGGIISQLMARITSGGITPIKIAWILRYGLRRMIDNDTRLCVYWLSGYIADRFGRLYI